jgi:hypothetical protein
MKHYFLNKRALTLAAALILAPCLGKAENAAPTNLGSSASGSANTSGTVLQVSEGSFTAAQMPANSDRAQKSKAAAAAAKAGSALQQVNCMKMQADAASEKDPDAQYWKQIAASMQCQQAQQSQQSAEENEEQSKALSSADVPKPASFKAGAVSISGSPSESNIEIPEVQTPTRSAGTSNNGDSEETNESSASRSVAEQKPATGTSDGIKETNSAPTVPTDLPKTGLAPIQSGSVTFKEDAQTGQALGGNSAGLINGTGGAGSASLVKEDKASAKSDEINADIAQIERGIRAINGGSESGSGSDSSDAPKSSGILDALMAQLNPETLPMGFGGAAMEEIAATESGDTTARINIFEYATYRYQLAVNTQNRIDVKRTKMQTPAVQPSLPTRALASPMNSDLLSASRAQ